VQALCRLGRGIHTGDVRQFPTQGGSSQGHGLFALVSDDLAAFRRPTSANLHTRLDRSLIRPARFCSKAISGSPLGSRKCRWVAKP
jgi:hypothetical protein